MTEVEVTVLATKIARYVFECGGEPKSPCQRIQFMGGHYPDNETPQGGFCEMALLGAVAHCLREHFNLNQQQKE